MTSYATFSTCWQLLLFPMMLLCGCDEDSLLEDAPKHPNKAELLKLVNDYRQSGRSCGSEVFSPTEPVVWNDLLEEAAQMHSNDMSRNHFLSHTGSDGNDPGHRISSVGYVWRTYGENIAKGYASEREVIAGWIKSEGHCENIMDPDFTEMGVATSGVYWTQVFGTLRANME